MRLFVAIPVPESVKKRLGDLQQPIEGVRWQQQGQLHITLKFLGDTDRDRAQDLQAHLDEIDCSVFSMTLNGFGYFPKGKHPRVLWAGIEKNKSLKTLYNEVERQCTALGFEKESRSFKPHITLARTDGVPKRNIMSFINQHKQFRISDVAVEEFVLYESKLNPDGAKHSRVKTFELTGSS